jgi:plasmid stabilization system protein ParE
MVRKNVRRDLKATLLCLVFSCCWCDGVHHLPHQFGKRVFFDQSYNQTASPYDTAFQGMSRFAADLIRRGFVVEMRSKPLSSWLNSIQCTDCIIFLGLAMGQRYAEKDITAILDFIERGGHAIVVGEHDNVGQNADFQNQLLKKFEIKITDVDALGRDRANQPSAWPLAYSDFLSSKPTVYAAAKIEIANSKSVELLRVKQPRDGNSIVAVGAEFGKGTIAVISDSEIFWNMNNPEGYRRKENANFIQSVLIDRNWRKDSHLLSEREAVPVTQVAPRLRQGTGIPITFYENNSFCNILPNHNSLSRFALKIQDFGYYVHYRDDRRKNSKVDVAIICNPKDFTRLPSADTMADRLIVILDGRSSLDQNKIWHEALLKRGLTIGTRRDFVDTAFLKSFGVVMPPYTLVDAVNGDSFHTAGELLIYGEPRPLQLHRSGYILFNRSAPTFKVLARAVSGTRPMRSILEYAHSEKVDARSYLTTFVTIAHSKRLFLIADYELVSDESFEEVGNEVTIAIGHWLNGLN